MLFVHLFLITGSFVPVASLSGLWSVTAALRMALETAIWDPALAFLVCVFRSVHRESRRVSLLRPNILLSASVTGIARRWPWSSMDPHVLLVASGPDDWRMPWSPVGATIRGLLMFVRVPRSWILCLRLMSFGDLDVSHDRRWRRWPLSVVRHHVQFCNQLFCVSDFPTLSEYGV